MQVLVLFFGILKDLLKRESESLTLPSNATVEDLLQHYGDASPRLKEFLPSIAVSINQEYAHPAANLNDGDEVGLLPPVSGGSQDDSPALSSSSIHSVIVREKIDTDRVLAEIKYASDGATVVFEGIVRNHTRNRRTLYLDYEAYEEMAIKQMESLARQAAGNFKIRNVRIVHRLGRLAIGETSVLIVVASEHRGAAFDACRWVIDTLKRTVPIWKKEYFEDGAVWADGEPFPEEIARGEGTH